MEENRINIAYFTADLNKELVSVALSSVSRFQEEHSGVYVHVFDCFSFDLHSDVDGSRYQIYDLPDLARYDAVLVQSHEIMNSDVLRKLEKRIVSRQIPAVSVGVRMEGCVNIGRSLNDTRGLFHSFRDARAQMLRLFDDLRGMAGERCLDWEIAFELRLKRSRHIRIYADVLILTEDRVFSLEFKMKDRIEPEEVLQAAKYSPWLEIVFGPDYEVIPVLVLTAAHEFFDFVPIGETDALLPVCSGDMLFNVFDEYLGFLK